MQYPSPWLLGVIVVLLIAVLCIAAYCDYIGIRHDGYRAAHGTDPEAPYNKARAEIEGR